MLDLIIIGGGPIGIAIGLEAQKAGLNYLILEKGVLVNSLFNYPVNMQFFSSSEKLEIGGIPFISKEAKPKRDEALEYYRRIVSSNSLRIHLFEAVEHVEKQESHFEIKSSKGQYQARQLALSTGFYDIPNKLNVTGEELDKVSHYYNDPHYYARQKVAVVGASNSAIDAALECWRKGADVSLIIRGEEVGKRVKYWVRPDILNRIEEGSIRAYFNTQITEIKAEELILIDQKEKSEFRLANDFVLALTGYQPNFQFLEGLGVKLSEEGLKKPEYNLETMESNVEGLYLAGVICGGLETHKWFIENSRIHAPRIVADIQRKIQKRPAYA